MLKISHHWALCWPRGVQERKTETGELDAIGRFTNLENFEVGFSTMKTDWSSAHLDAFISSLTQTERVKLRVLRARHYATSCKVAGSISDETLLVTEMSIRNLPRGKGRPSHKADNLTAHL
jgi:hypothetical protein